MTASQLFKQIIPIDNLFHLLDSICVKTDRYYELSNISFKKGIFNNTIPTFIEQCKPFYHNSKQKYLVRPLTYNSFITIIRQICNSNSIAYHSKIKYEKTGYDIRYHILFNPCVVMSP
jgi:hypothetical protein